MSDHEHGSRAADTNEDAPSPELRVMIDEVRTSAPRLDWDRLEARLFDADGNVHEHSGVQRVSQPALQEKRSKTPQPRTRWAAVGAGLALAAAFAIAILSPTGARNDVAESPSKGSATTAPAPRAPVVGDDGHPVAVGQRIVASSGAWLKSSGRITIHLEPGTIATVLDVGERVHLSLESGAVTADVVPVAGGEPFAVDVAGHRVAVHGTRLRVALLGQAVQVAVSEGSAVVGVPRGQGRTEGALVHFGNVGRFEVPGAPGAISNDPSLATRLVDDGLAQSAKPTTTIAALEPVVAPPAHNAQPTHPIATAPTPSAAVEPNVEPVAPAPKPGLSAEQTSGPLGKLQPSLLTCAPKTKGLTIEQDLTITIAPDGKASLTSAEPGLDPAVRPCWNMVVSALTFPTAEGTTVVKRHVVVQAP